MRLVRLFSVILFAGLHFSGWSADIEERAIQEARAKSLYESPYWEVLLHYKMGWFDNYRSLIDDPRFFLSADGKYDKKKELEATIRGILSPSQVPDEHAQCRFPARTAWLESELDSLKGNLPKANCENFDNITKKIAPEKATMIFPFYSLGEPGSIFGHTLIRLEPANSASLLGHAVTYAADAQNPGALEYIVKGIGGGFVGKYTVLSYSKKINEYAAIEQRDVWEYQLNLTKEEVWRMYLHMWEMSLVTSDYYFFDENCAYNLLFFFEAARPGVKLTDDYFWVIPVDTIRDIRAKGLVSEVNYIPSYIKRMEAAADTLSHRGVTFAKDIADGKISPADIQLSDLSVRQQVAALDLSSELVRYSFQKYTGDELTVYKNRSFDISYVRAQYPEKNEYIVPRPAVTPDEAHRSTRLLIGGGYGNNSPFVRLGWRLVYHSLEDNPAGYLEGSNVDAINTSFKYYTDTGKFNLEHIRLLEITSLSPVTKLFTPISWRMGLGVEDRTLRSDRTKIRPYLRGGAGITVSVQDDSLAWILAMADVEGDSKYSSYLVAGGGVYAGYIYPTGAFGKFLMEANHMWYSDSGNHINADISASYIFYPAIEHAFSVKGIWARESNDYLSEFSLSYMFLF